MTKRINGCLLRATMLSIVVALSGCRENITGMESFFRGHSILIVSFSKEPDRDVVLLENVLKTGGSITCGYDSNYAEFLREFDPLFEMASASDSEGKYLIKPAILNWISSKGWKFRQKFCINMNYENAEYYFVK